jgi:hypothetical protein
MPRVSGILGMRRRERNGEMKVWAGEGVIVQLVVVEHPGNSPTACHGQWHSSGAAPETARLRLSP